MKTTNGDSVETATPKKKRPVWLGGFIRVTARGKRVYVIEKRIGGVLFKASTRKHTEDAAIKEFRKFEADPGGYDPTKSADSLIMTPELVLEHVDWQTAPRPAGLGNDHEWALTCGSFLKAWLEAYGNRDLRRVTAVDIKQMLRRWKTSVPNRVSALKGFYSWLRKEKGLLKHHEDPTPDVPIPGRRAAKETETGARDASFEKVQRVYAHLREDVRDILLLLSGTGWHVSEVRRFVTNGEIRKDPTGKHLATLVTFHKLREHAVSGLTHPEHLEAARRLREKGYMLSRKHLATLMLKANIAAGIDPETERPVYLGDMRHSVGTWAIEDGEDIAATAKAFNHTSEKMLRRHYVRHAVPRATIKTRVLKG